MSPIAMTTEGRGGLVPSSPVCAEGFRADILVEGKVILELKSVEQLAKVHHKQLFTYLKLAE